jgi:hypothetical protein
MRQFLLITISIFSSIFMNAQGWGYNWDIKAHDKGQLKFQLGAGIQRTENKFWFYKPAQLFDKQDWPESAKDNNFDPYLGQNNFKLRSTGPYTARFEYGMNRAISISLGATYTQYNASWFKTVSDLNTGTFQPVRYGVNVGNLGVAARLVYHPVVTTHLDVYIGGGPGYDTWMIKDFTANTRDTTYSSAFKKAPVVYYDYGVGARYYFRRRSALFAEVGYGKSFANLGVIIKILQPKSNRGY